MQHRAKCSVITRLRRPCAVSSVPTPTRPRTRRPGFFGGDRSEIALLDGDENAVARNERWRAAAWATTERRRRHANHFYIKRLHPRRFLSPKAKAPSKAAVREPRRAFHRPTGSIVFFSNSCRRISCLLVSLTTHRYTLCSLRFTLKNKNRFINSWYKENYVVPNHSFLRGGHFVEFFLLVSYRLLFDLHTWIRIPFLPFPLALCITGASIPSTR